MDTLEFVKGKSDFTDRGLYCMYRAYAYCIWPFNFKLATGDFWKE